jgi:hypothetical protein
VHYATLRRTGDLYGTPLDQVVDMLIADGSATTTTARVWLVVFTRYPASMGFPGRRPGR